MAGRIGSLADYMEGGRSSAKLTWERSGFGPPDVDVAQIYDGFSASVANHFRLFIIPGMETVIVAGKLRKWKGQLLAAQKGADPGGVDPATRRPGEPAAGGHGFRGRTLDRPDLARAARPRRRAYPQPPGAADRDISPRVPAALDRPAAGDDARAQSPGPARPDRIGNADRGCQSTARRGRRSDRRSHRRCAAVCRGNDQECLGKRRYTNWDPDKFARLIDGAARPLGTDAANCADRRCDRTRVSPRAGACCLAASRGRAARFSGSPRRLRAGVRARNAARRGL